MLNRAWLVLSLAIFASGCADEPTSVRDQATAPAIKVSASTPSTPADCPACVFGPRVYTRKTATPATEAATFPGDPAADYVIDIDDNGSQGADASVTLNGVVQLAPRTKVDVGPRHLRRAVSLVAQNTMKVRLTGKPGSTLTVSILGGTKAIGPRGGTITVPGGRVSLRVPPGGLAADVEVTIAPATPPVWADPSLQFIGFAYDIDLHGAKLTIPGELRLALPDGDDNGLIDGTSLPLAHAAFLRYVPERNAWDEPLQWFDQDSKTLVIRTAEFSGWALWVPVVWGGLPRQLLWEIDMSNAPPSTSTAGLASQVQLAFSLWQAETDAAGLTFRRVAPGENPNIVVEFADLEFGSSGVTYGIHTYGLGKRYVRLNKNLGGWGSPVSYLADVIIHEVGHAIGMRHVGRGEEPPIMAPQPNFQPDLHLYQDDIDQVRARYNVVRPLVTFIGTGTVYATTDPFSLLPNLLHLPYGPGTTFTFAYTFDRLEADADPGNDRRGFYRAITSLTVTVGNNASIRFADAPAIPALRQILIFLGPFGYDEYHIQVEPTLGTTRFDIDMFGPVGGVFSNDALPTTPPNLNLFFERRADLRFCPTGAFNPCGVLWVSITSLVQR